MSSVSTIPVIHKGHTIKYLCVGGGGDIEVEFLLHFYLQENKNVLTVNVWQTLFFCSVEERNSPADL